jgi:hypothetical protein
MKQSVADTRKQCEPVNERDIHRRIDKTACNCFESVLYFRAHACESHAHLCVHEHAFVRDNS